MLPDPFLPEPLPDNPLPLFVAWFDEARQRALQPNPDAMVLATVGATAHPAARVVLCKQLAAQDGFIVFYSNQQSRKGRELAAQPRAAAVFHWDHLHRQVRIEGPVVDSPASESDAYFASRALPSRIGAWSSPQSEPLVSRAALAAQVQATAQRFGVDGTSADAIIPRPPHWGGQRLWIETLELWMEGPGRIHDRAVWRRPLAQRDPYSFDGGKWQATRLNP